MSLFIFGHDPANLASVERTYPRRRHLLARMSISRFYFRIFNRFLETTHIIMQICIRICKNIHIYMYSIYVNIHMQIYMYM